jgi:hypothetical protein
MSFNNNNHLQQNSYGSHGRNNNNMSSIESLFGGDNNMAMLSSAASSSNNNTNPAQLGLSLNPLETMGRFYSSGSAEDSLNTMRTMNRGGNLGGDKRLPQFSSHSQLTGGASANNRQGTLGDELKRLQQLQQLSSTQNTSNHNHNQLMQGLFGNPPNHQSPSLTMASFNQGLNVGGLSQRDAATYLLMNHHHHQQQQQRTLHSYKEAV